jgi:hypothetical protein
MDTKGKALQTAAGTEKTGRKVKRANSRCQSRLQKEGINQNQVF